MGDEKLYTAIGRIASDIDTNIGWYVASHYLNEGVIDQSEYKKALEFQRLEEADYTLTPAQRKARSHINQKILHSHSRSELVMDFGITWLDELTVAKNGWRWTDKPTSPPKPKAPPLPGGYTPRVQGVAGFYEDREVEKLVLAAVQARIDKGTAPDRPSICVASLPITLTIPMRSKAGKVTGHGEVESESRVVVILDPDSMIAIVMPLDKSPPEIQERFPA